MTPGYSYADYLIPGIVVQNIAFGGFVTAIGLNEDLHKGLIDRFRSLPMARAAVLAGRTLADVVTNSLSAAIVVGTGLLVGFSFHTGVGEVLAGAGLLLRVRLRLLVGVRARRHGRLARRKAPTRSGFIAIFPLTFISSAFVPVASMPEPLQAFAEVNPFTVIVDAVRALWLGAPAGNYVWGAFAWSVAIIAVFAPLAVARYRRATAV